MRSREEKREEQASKQAPTHSNGPQRQGLCISPAQARAHVAQAQSPEPEPAWPVKHEPLQRQSSLPPHPTAVLVGHNRHNRSHSSGNSPGVPHPGQLGAALARVSQSVGPVPGGHVNAQQDAGRGLEPGGADKGGAGCEKTVGHWPWAWP